MYLKKHVLDFDRTYNYLYDNLENLNILSEFILKYVDMKKGFFFTLLPNDASLDQLYTFDYGGIIPQDSNKTEIVHITNIGDFIGVQVKNIKNELAEFIFKYLSQSDKYLAIFDEYQIKKTSPFARIENVESIIYKDKEVYHLLDSKNTEKEISNVVRKTHAIWHSLCILLKIEIQIPEELTDNILEKICQNIEYIILSAYDGEGYIFWTRNEILDE